MKKLPHNIMFEYKQDESLTIKYLMIEPTNICNSNCMFCSRKYKNQAPKNMGLDELKRITPFFNAVKFVKIQGLGESLFNPDLHLLLAHLKNVYPGVILFTATNMNFSKTDQELSAILKDLDILYLSIDGGRKETYEKIRRGCYWETMLDTLGQLSGVKKPHNIFVVSFIASDLNYREIDKVVALAEGYPIDELRINPVQDWTTDNRLTQPENYSGKEYIQELRRWNELGTIQDMVITVVGDPTFDYTYCVWPFERMYIDVYGNVFICCLSLDDVWCQGNIFKEHPDAIFKNTTMNAIRSCMRLNKAHKHCQTCSYKLLVPALKKIKEP